MGAVILHIPFGKESSISEDYWEPYFGKRAYCEIILKDRTILLTYKYDIIYGSDEDGAPTESSYWVISFKELDNPIRIFDKTVPLKDSGLSEAPNRIPAGNYTIRFQKVISRWAKKNNLNYTMIEGDYSPTPNSIKYILSD